ncbi:MAG: hypothetical protein JWP58_4476 [Hymenobacter sp.]|nr:hypothetical protein [Hymenobacter sp.]
MSTCNLLLSVYRLEHGSGFDFAGLRLMTTTAAEKPAAIQRQWPGVAVPEYLESVSLFEGI